MVLKLGNDMCRSKVMEKNLNPAFFETFDFAKFCSLFAICKIMIFLFLYSVTLLSPLSVCVYDAKKANLLGSGLVYLNMIKPGQPTTVWVNFPDVCIACFS